ncbi:MAG: preprotein translocase subunit SecE [Nitrospirae bacterium]|nr:preprotein translocase subunit SecE [Nitrospirota bacterium]
MLDKIKAYFKEVKIELKKVVFPNREEVIGSTKVVVVTVIIISFFLGLIDLGLTKLISLAF